MGEPVIRVAVAGDDPALRRGIVELQEHERRLHPSRRPGPEMAAEHLRWLKDRTARAGAILVAEVDGEFAGFAAGWVRQEDHAALTPEASRFGYVSDICVMPEHRRRGIARRLLAALEQRFVAAGVGHMLLYVLAGNTMARAVYEREGFVPYELAYEKPIGRGE